MSLGTRFLADAMLERLARWLRALDVDVVSAPPGAPDSELVRIAAAESRVILTRDRGEVLARGPTLIVRADRPLDQLREVAARYGIDATGALFARCLLCNAPLRPATAEEIAAEPAARGATVQRCPACARLYWEGGHTRRMRAALTRALEAPAGS
jgi:uncharacterized protein with PIN domain